jgi:DNA-binding transcriptional ArsR family regulator
MNYETTLTALADPTRRAILARLRRRPHAVGELARAVSVTQPAASQHLAVLRKARLVRSRQEGTRSIYTVVPEGLEPLRAYLESFWDDVLLAYAGTSRVGRRRRGSGQSKGNT